LRFDGAQGRFGVRWLTSFANAAGDRPIVSRLEVSVFNLDIGSRTEVDGRTCILTKLGLSGHAVYGPYQHLDPGHYAVEFNLEAAEDQQLDRDDICATVDVVSGFGRRSHAREDVSLSRLREGPVRIHLAFEAKAPDTFEFRVATNGLVPLLIDDYCRLLSLNGTASDCDALFDASRFPDPRMGPKPAFFLDHLSILRRFHENDAGVKIVDGDVIVTIDGISFYARVPDDLRFVDEIFFRSTYNFFQEKDCCVIDIGMNIGLVSMTFARKDFVKTVYSFEPFKGTYDRARANLSLNQEIAAKISAHNFGLADADEDKTVLIYNETDSGAFSIRGSDRGTPATISVRNAATVLGPIIEAAKAQGLRIIAKVDCEGSEFPIFATLEQHGLLAEISAFMVEWHRGNWGKTQHDLIAPLLMHDFTVFDLTGKTGNGFFYAVKGLPA
jgi:FkbM family methyltransferase